MRATGPSTGGTGDSPVRARPPRSGGQRATPGEITRRAALLAACAAPLFAGPAEDAWNLVASLATELSANNGVEFLSHVDPRMPGYETLYADILALTREAALSSSIDPVANQGDDRGRTLEVDWILELRGRENSAIFQRRHEKLKFQLKKKGRHWRVVGLEPLRFFRPA